MNNKSERTPQTFVGIGASAGGITALQCLLPNLPIGCGFTYLLVQHLDPEHLSTLDKILSKDTALIVEIAVNGSRIYPDHFYIAPSNNDLSIIDGVLHLEEIPETKHGHSVDTLLTSIAEAHGTAAVGIILSGTGTDGLQGARKLKAMKGLVLAQDPCDSEHEGMPKAIISAGLADFIAPATGIGTELAQLVGRTIPYTKPSVNRPDTHAGLIEILKSKTRFAFDQYKASTLSRRIDRRMAANKLEMFNDYVDLVEESDTEADALSNEMAISVTDFFRDEGAFVAIDETIKLILARKTQEEFIRIWVPGCATGEEAYSIAILVSEALGDRRVSTNIQIFATDVDARAIVIARKGIYLKPALNKKFESLFNKYFQPSDDNTYTVNSSIRDTVVFAEHDLIRDPPFGRLDLISCRNVFIYIKRAAQERLLNHFHYSLNTAGFLVLGTSESIQAQNDFFNPAHQTEKVYVATAVQQIPSAISDLSPLHRPPIKTAATMVIPTMEQLIQQTLYEQYKPPSILVNSRSEILHLHGALAPFMELPQGSITFNALELVISPLRLELRVLLKKVYRERRVIHSRTISLVASTGQMMVTLVAIPIKGKPDAGHDTLVLFQRDVPAKRPINKNESIEEADFRTHETAQEIAATTDLLKTCIQEMELTEVELQSIKAESHLANEDFQITNEELKSANEELHTVNEELTNKTAELEISNNDLESILNTALEAVIVLDEDLKITRYSSGTKHVIDLMPKSIDQTKHNIAGAIDLTLFWSDIKAAMQSRQIVRQELILGEVAYVVRLTPVVSGGLVISFFDETERLKAGLDERRLAAVVRDSNDAITVQNADGQFIAWNRGAERLYGFDEIDALTMNIRDIVPLGHRDSAVDYLQQLMAGEAPQSIEVKRLTKSGRELHVWITATALYNDHGEIYAVATTERDLTERLADEVQQLKLDTNAQDISDRFERLTPREQEVLKLLVAGSAAASSRQIAKQLNISVRTVETHRRRIKEKVDAKSMPDLVEKAKMFGFYLPMSD